MDHLFFHRDRVAANRAQGDVKFRDSGSEKSVNVTRDSRKVSVTSQKSTELSSDTSSSRESSSSRTGSDNVVDRKESINSKRDSKSSTDSKRTSRASIVDPVSKSTPRDSTASQQPRESIGSMDSKRSSVVDPRTQPLRNSTPRDSKVSQLSRGSNASNTHFYAKKGSLDSLSNKTTEGTKHDSSDSQEDTEESRSSSNASSSSHKSSGKGDNDIIEAMTASGDVHSAPPQRGSLAFITGSSSRRSSVSKSSTHRSDGGFEILHEEKVDDGLLEDVMNIVREHEDQSKEEKDMAKALKDNVEKRHGRHWQAIVAGKNLGCNVEHEVNTFVYLRRGNHIYILFRTPISDNDS